MKRERKNYYVCLNRGELGESLDSLKQIEEEQVPYQVIQILTNYYLRKNEASWEPHNCDVFPKHTSSKSVLACDWANRTYFVAKGWETQLEEVMAIAKLLLTRKEERNEN